MTTPNATASSSTLLSPLKLKILQRDKQSLDYLFRSGLAGGAAGCIAKTVVAPLDRVKILFQTGNPEFQKFSGTWSGAFRATKVIYASNGVRSLFQGHSATLLRVFPYAAIKFVAYDQVHDYLMPTKESETGLRRFAAGAFAGTSSVLFTYPLELIRVRLAYDTRSSASISLRPSLSNTISSIYREGNAPLPKLNSPAPTTIRLPPSRLFDLFPVLKFYRGFNVTILGMVPYAGTSFLVWGSLQSHFFPRSDPNDPTTKPPRTVLNLVLGAVSGATAQTVSYPFEVVRRRLQIGGLIRPTGWVGWGETVRDIWKRAGWRGFFVGLSIGYVKVVPMTAVSFASWEGGKRLLGI